MSPYFDPAYFSPTYFDTGSGPVNGGGRGGRVMRSVKPQPLDDEEGLLMVLIL